ncbi:hypothetical protein QR77_03450 [Streptomyces sp. 150FB]|uniref:hypothetical protein n=1 Tax=Streptomyces sp. 150FB TaxID=1576605 RepID=UPI000589252C|nr:hypothetical protein [Streptomyces sp. 150FB]KIF73276.1 hypothetical protein QR77_03450 [Streptomyces sp. 150FB]
MPVESTHGDIHTGDVSGTFVVGDNNRVTNTTPHPDPQQPQPPQQQSSAKDKAAAFAVQDGIMHVTYNAAAERAAQG